MLQAAIVLLFDRTDSLNRLSIIQSHTHDTFKPL